MTRNKIQRTFASWLRVVSRRNLRQASAVLICASVLFVGSVAAQKRKPNRKPKTSAVKTSVRKNPPINLPKVTRIDAAALEKLLVPNGKPLLINFWATWCDPCREEFPDLVKISTEYKDKIDVITISLDDLAEINNSVPKFLAQMRSDSPAYLLKVPDEGEAIAVVSKEWQGGLPYTILYDQTGTAVYSKQGKFDVTVLRAEIDKIAVQ